MKRNILITGGELFNKGAQSMTFITVNELKKRFPNHEILLSSSRDFKRDYEEKQQYNFKICHDVFQYLFAFGSYARLKKMDKDLIAKSKEILKMTDIIIDISGFALSSNSLRRTIYYLSKFNIARKYNIKAYIMPQSFGPFVYNKFINPFLHILIANTLQYPEVIFAREKEGYDLLRTDMKLTNVKLSPDLVLLSEEIDLENIYKKRPELKEYNIKNNSVGIIPNMKNFHHGNREEIITLYEKIINYLIKDGMNVYLIRHSFEDIEACQLIKSRFKENENVMLFSDDLSCLEFEKLVVKFDFLIASRYHSIIHAYKNGIPCISIGWATKYKELLQMFKQEHYNFDVRGKLNFDAVLTAIKKMKMQFKNESLIIRKVIEELPEENIFDHIKISV